MYIPDEMIYEAIVLEREKVRERIPEDKNKDNDNRDADSFEGEFPVDMKDLEPNEAAIAIGYGEEGSERYTGKFFDRDEDPTLNYYDSF